MIPPSPPVQDGQWTLEELAIVANDLLPKVLPDVAPGLKTNAKLSEEITPRLIRYYVNQGVLDEPIREGKFAFYGQRHLWQLLVCRRLLSEGFTVAVIKAIAKDKTQLELQAMLTDGIEFHLTAANATLQTKTEAVKSRQWLHIQIREGLEIHLRSDVVLPKTALEYQHFWAEIEQVLQQYTRSNG